MSDPLRISLRLAGLVLFVGGLVAVVAVMALGPHEVALKMGRSCAHNSNESEWCSWRDVLSMLQMLPYITLIGAVLLLVMRRQWVGRERDDDGSSMDDAPTGLWGMRSLAGLVVVALVAVNFASVFVYRHTYTVAHQVQVTKKILRDAPRPDFAQRSVR